MLRLDTTTRKLQAVLAGAITTNQLPILVSWADKSSTDYAGGSTPTNTNSTTAVDICAAPGASTIRDIDYISVRNADTAAATVTIRYNDNSTTYDICKATLAVGDHLVYVHGSGWQVIDADGNLQTGSASGGIALSDNNTWTGTNTFRNAAGIRSEQAATQDAIAMIGRAGGTSSYEVTITPTTLTADRTVTAQNKTGTMALLEGTTTNDSASAGQVGEYVESVVGSVNAPTSGQYGDLTSISLTAGDWDVCALAVCSLNGATMTATDGPRLGISTTSGNSSTGLAWGDTLHQSLNPTTGVSTGLTIATKRVTLSGTTTYYLKMLAAYSAGTPVFSGRISARRVR